MEYRPRRPLWVKPSIRPRRCRRGERSTRRLRHDPRGAPSIRPRRCRRGEPTKSAATPTSRFTFNSASTLSSRRTADPEGASEVVNDILQFGLDAVVEENRRSRPTWPSRTSSPFNSASTLSSRRTADPNVLWAWCVRLQFGLDAVVEENSTPSTTNFARCGPLQFGLDAVVEENADSEPAPVQTVQAFNSASTLSSRRTAPARGVRAQGRAFNSASTLSSRRTVVSHNRPASGGGHLQFGLDAVVEENVAAAQGKPAEPVPSIRPRRCRRGERRDGWDEACEAMQPSIRPRRCRRGEPGSGSTRRPAAAAFNSASTLSSRRTRADPTPAAPGDVLQFGLDAVVEENVAAIR